MILEKWEKFIVALSVAAASAFIFSVLPAIGSVCHVLPTPEQIANSSGSRRFVKYGTCPEGSYNEMASLTLGSGEDAIKHTFARDSYTFDNGVLWGFLFAYTFTFVINTGTFMPAGNFVPNVIMGGIMGRIFGNIAAAAYGDVTVHSNAGVYAVIGATCMLSCWTRTMPAIMVVMFEVTSDTSLTIPMLLISTLARSIATLFGTDGWAHMLCHAEWVGLPHHAVPPSKWIDMKFMKDEDLVAHPHGHGEHGEEHHEKMDSTPNPMVKKADVHQDL